MAASNQRWSERNAHEIRSFSKRSDYKSMTMMILAAAASTSSNDYYVDNKRKNVSPYFGLEIEIRVWRNQKQTKNDGKKVKERELMQQSWKLTLHQATSKYILHQFDNDGNATKTTHTHTHPPKKYAEKKRKGPREIHNKKVKIKRQNFPSHAKRWKSVQIQNIRKTAIHFRNTCDLLIRLLACCLAGVKLKRSRWGGSWHTHTHTREERTK